MKRRTLRSVPPEESIASHEIEYPTKVSPSAAARKPSEDVRADSSLPNPTRPLHSSMARTRGMHAISDYDHMMDQQLREEEEEQIEEMVVYDEEGNMLMDYEGEEITHEEVIESVGEEEFLRHHALPDHDQRRQHIGQPQEMKEEAHSQDVQEEDDDQPPQLEPEEGPGPEEIMMREEMEREQMQMESHEEQGYMRSPGGRTYYQDAADEDDMYAEGMDQGLMPMAHGDAAPLPSDLTVEFNFLDNKHICCGLCGEVVPYDDLLRHHLPVYHPELYGEFDMMGLEEISHDTWLKEKLCHERKMENGLIGYPEQHATILMSRNGRNMKALRTVSQIRVNVANMTITQLEVALRRKMVEKMGRRVKVSLVDKQHARCGICNAVVSLNKKFEVVHLVRHFNAWHPYSHRCAGTWPHRASLFGPGKPLTSQDFAIVDVGLDAPESLQCIWCGMFMDRAMLAMHFHEVHQDEVEVPKCNLCLQEMVINARLMEKYGEEFEITLPDEHHIRCLKVQGSTFSSEASLDRCIDRRLRRMAAVVKGEQVIHEENEGADEEEEPKEVKYSNSRMAFGRGNRVKRNFIMPSLRQAIPQDSRYVEALAEGEWRCKLCNCPIMAAVISAGAIKHYQQLHPEQLQDMQYELCQARLERVSDGCMEFVHPSLIECLICNMTYTLHKPYNMCRGIRHLKLKHPEMMPEYGTNGDQLGTVTVAKKESRRQNEQSQPPQPPVTAQVEMGEYVEDPEIINKLKQEYDIDFDKVRAMYGPDGRKFFVLLSNGQEIDPQFSENIQSSMRELSQSEEGEGGGIEEEEEYQMRMLEEEVVEQHEGEDVHDEMGEELAEEEEELVEEQQGTGLTMSHAGAASSSGSRLRIRAFPTAMDDAYIEQSLTMLGKAIREIQMKNNGGLSFEELYRSAYTMVLHKHGERVYDALRGVVGEHLKGPIRGLVVGTMDERFLDTLNRAWSEHSIAMVMIRDIFMYLDRVYVEQQKCAPVNNLCIGMFRDEIVRADRVSDHLRKVLLEMVAEERAGVTVKWSAIKDAVSMLIALGVDNKKVYDTEFEQPFLTETAEFYKAASQKFLEENSASVYVEKVEKCIVDETDRAARYLDKDTKDKLLKVLDDVLISQHMQTVVDMENSGLKAMLREDKVAELHSLYVLLRRVDNGLAVMTTCMSEYLRTIGEKLVDDVEGGATETADAGSGAAKKDPVNFIQELIDLKDRFDHFLKDAFENDASFKTKIQTDFVFFINKNKRSPEFLSLYIDDKLKKGQKSLNDIELESMFDQSTVLFRFLAEKDAFEKYYKQHVAKRLLLDKSVSDDAEKQMITKLRTECGSNFTQKLESMFKDKEIWTTLNVNFKEHCVNKPIEVQTDVRVLTAGIWPTQSAGPQCVVLPDSCQAAFKHFETFYTGAHNGRKLTLNTLLGSADIKATFYGANADEESEAGPSSRAAKRKRQEEQKILQVNTHTMILLLKFNNRPMHTFETLKSETQIPERDLQRCLQSLSMGKPTQRILTRKGKGKEIEDKDEFTVNDLFTSKLTRIRIQNVANKRDAEPESKETRKEIDDDRKHEVEAAIVRTMKARKNLQHNELIVEVTEQLQSRFKPDPQLIKTRIESLIEREYLKRSEENHRVYQYQA